MEVKPRQNMDGKRWIEAFEMWCYREMLKISWVDKIMNEKILRRTEERGHTCVTY